MANFAFLFTGICLIVMGLTAKVVPDPAAPAPSNPQEAARARRAEHKRRILITGLGMAAVLLALYRFGHHP